MQMKRSVILLSERNKIWILFGLALIARLIALPFSQIVEADATSRLFLAEHALHHGGELTSLQWQSLHIYFLSLGQFISGERFWGPVVLTMFFVAASVIPFYLFTKNIFNRDGAFYAALIYTFSPLVFRFGFTPLSEGYHLAFCVTALWCVSEGIYSANRKMRWALVAGIAATIACGGRFEAWILTALLGLILLILREWKMALVYGLVASVFPVYWLIYCYMKTGNALVSIEMVEYFNFKVARVNDHLDDITRFNRKVFFPFSWITSLSPVVVLIMLVSARHLLVRPFSNLPRMLFTLLFLFFFVFFIYQSITGSLYNQHRFTITLVMLSLPLYSLWFEKKTNRFRIISSVVIAALLIPWSFSWQNLPWNKIVPGRSYRDRAIQTIVLGSYWQVQAVPRIRQQDFVRIADKINAELRPGDGVFVDWCGWINTYYLGHRIPLAGGDMLLSCEENPEPVNYTYFNSFFTGNPCGIMLLSDFSILSGETSLHGSLLEIKNIPGGLMLEPLLTQSHYRLFRYKLVSAEEVQIQRQKLNFTPPLYTIEKDKAYFEITILNDGAWLTDILQEANKHDRSLKKQIDLVAENMAEQEKLKQNKQDTLK